MVKFYRKRLGDMLLSSGLVNEEQLDEALSEQRAGTQKSLGKVLVSKGYATERQILEILEQQLGIPFVQLSTSTMDADVATSIPFNLAQRYMIIPIARNKKRLTLAMSDPLNIPAIDDVAMITGCEVEPVLAGEKAIEQAIEQFYGIKESVEKSLKFQEKEEDELDPAHIAKLVENAPVVRFVNSLLNQAASEGASDIHLEPKEKRLRIRIRVDGVLHDVMTPLHDVQLLVISRIKIISGMNIAERRLPQDGSLSMRYMGRIIDVRVSSLPTVYGEKIVMRLLDKEKMLLPIEKLNLSEHNLAVFSRILKSSYGMLIVTGPTGSGKTTTLYSSLKAINTPEKNIITVEDPVEYRLDDINQVQVIPKIGLTFSYALRSILRQDPDVIMIGEIRDAETADIAVKAALTGHLVFSTLHTNDAPRALSRLVDMGVEPFLLTSSIVGIIAQRLIRRICPHCKAQYEPSRDELDIYAHYCPDGVPSVLYSGKGCGLCNNTGYKGRTAVHEILTLSSEIRDHILSGGNMEQIKKAAVASGMITLQQDAFRLVGEGITTIREVIRVTFEGN